MRISIGILAYNESASISTTIRSIFAQGLLRRAPGSVESIEVVCVPNGCTDDTAEVARRALGAEMAGLPAETAGRVRWRLEELARGGKTNAWNEYVHRFADQGAAYIVMVDGDVRLLHPQTLSNLVGKLESTPAANVCVGQGVKHIAMKGRHSLLERLSMRSSEVNGGRRFGIWGGLYCGRGATLRRVWFPDGLIGDDAFLNGLIVTDLCRTPENFERVTGTEDATAVFEAYMSLPAVYKSLRRQAVIRGVDAMLWGYLWKNVGELDAGELIKRRSDEDPEWFKKLLREEIRRRVWWVMPRGALVRRIGFLRKLPRKRALSLLPAAAVGVAADIVVHVDANFRLRSGRVSGLWQTTRTTKIDLPAGTAPGTKVMSLNLGPGSKPESEAAAAGPSRSDV